MDLDRRVSFEEAKQFFAELNPPIRLYMEVSAKTGQGVNDVFEGAVNSLFHGASPVNDNEAIEETFKQKEKEKVKGKHHDDCIICW